VTSPLSVLDLAKQYNTPGRDPVLAVRGISFEIHEGECFGLLGPNGAGKSTSMNCISGFYPATSGSSKIFDIDVYAHPKQARMKLGVCAQEDTLDTDFSVMDQMVRYGTYFRVPVEEGRRRSAALLDALVSTTKRTTWWRGFRAECGDGFRWRAPWSAIRKS